MILVTGASGNVGSQVLKQVVKAGKPVKALYRSEKDTVSRPALAAQTRGEADCSSAGVPCRQRGRNLPLRRYSTAARASIWMAL